MSDEDIYAQIADELAKSSMDQALWTQAIALADGDEGRTKAAYIKLRHKALRTSVSQPKPDQSTGSADQTSPFTADPKLIDMLVAARKTTLYSALKVSPGASQEEIIEVCLRLRAKIRSGESLADIATLTYAIETLSDSDRRRMYDLSLLRDLPQKRGGPVPVPPTIESTITPRDFLSWWNAPRTLGVLIACGVVIATSTFFSYRNENVKREIEQAKAKNEQTKVERSSDIDAARVDNERVFVQGVTGNQAVAIQEGARIEDRRLDIADRAESRQGTALEYRANADREILGQSRRVIDEKSKHLEWQRQQYEQERSRQLAELQNARDRAALINTYLGRSQFLLARDVARTPEEVSRIERAEAAARQRQAATERSARSSDRQSFRPQGSR